MVGPVDWGSLVDTSVRGSGWEEVDTRFDMSDMKDMELLVARLVQAEHTITDNEELG